MTITNRVFRSVLVVVSAGLLAASCSMGPGLNISHGKGRVLVGAVNPNSARTLLGAPGRSLSLGKPSKESVRAAHAATVKSLATPRGTKPRTLSATYDIESITYSVQRLDDPSEPGFSDYMDPYYPYLDLYLTPGGRYRIIIDITPTPSAAHPSVGVNKFGDQQDFDVDPYYDTYIELFAHPVDVPALFKTNNGSQVIAYDPVTTSSNFRNGLSGANAHTSDKYFYSANGRLFWFSRTNNKIYEWPDLSSAIVAGDEVFAGTTISSSESILCASADPVYSDLIWIATTNSVGPTYSIYYIDVSAGSGVEYLYGDLTADVAGATAFEPLGIAADVLGDVYLASVFTVAGPALYSGITAYYYGGQYASFIPNSSPWTSSDSLTTDLIWGEGKLYALQAPQVSVITPNNTGMADIVAFDDYLTPLSVSAFTPTYSGAIPDVTDGTTPVFAQPTRFAAPVQGGFLYISQYNGGIGGGNIGPITAGDLLSIPNDLSTYNEVASFVNLP